MWNRILFLFQPQSFVIVVVGGGGIMLPIRDNCALYLLITWMCVQSTFSYIIFQDTTALQHQMLPLLSSVRLDPTAQQVVISLLHVHAALSQINPDYMKRHNAQTVQADTTAPILVWLQWWMSVGQGIIVQEVRMLRTQQSSCARKDYIAPMEV